MGAEPKNSRRSKNRKIRVKVELTHRACIGEARQAPAHEWAPERHALRYRARAFEKYAIKKDSWKHHLSSCGCVVREFTVFPRAQGLQRLQRPPRYSISRVYFSRVARHHVL